MAAEIFTVDEVHLALLDRLYIESLVPEWGGPMADQKRPYGNSDIQDDIREIYSEVNGLELIKVEDGGTILLDGDRVVARGYGEDLVSSTLEREFSRYHQEMATVLQILCNNRSIELGDYRKTSPYAGRWERI